MRDTQRSALARGFDWATLVLAVVLTVTVAVSCISRSTSHGQIDTLVKSLLPPETPEADQSETAKTDKDTPKTDKPEPDEPKPDKPEVGKKPTTGESSEDKGKPKADTPKPDEPEPDTPKPDEPKPDKPKVGKKPTTGESSEDKGKPKPDKPQPGKTESDKPKPNGATPEVNPDDEAVKRIVARSMFCPHPPKAFGAKLTGVLGDSAIFNNSQLVKVGGDVGGGKLLQLGPDWAEVEFEGKKIKQWVFGAAGAPSPGGAPPGPPGMPPGARGGMRRHGRPPRGMPPVFQLTPEMIEQFKQMPPEHRDRAMQSMPPEMAEKLKQAM